jgi:hypothetical protein
MNNPLNFSAAQSSSLSSVRSASGVSATQSPTAPTSRPGAQTAGPAGRSQAGAPVHMASEEMEKHIDEALDKSPVLNDEEAPLIDLEHLDAPAEEDELEAPEGEAEDFEAIELEAVEVSQKEEVPDDSEREAEGGAAGESRLAEELRRYQQDRSIPAKRHAHLIPNAQGEDRPREAMAAVACEGLVGGLARPESRHPGAFVGLAGSYMGKSFGVLGLANPGQIQPFIQALRKALARPDLEYMLLDLEKLPASHQGLVLKNLPACGAKPQRVLLWTGPGKVNWN